MDEHNHHAMVAGEHSPVEYLKFAAVIAGICLVSWFLAQSEGGLASYLQAFMGVFLLTFASFKFAGYRMFADMFAGYDVVAKRFKAYAYAFPFIELCLGLFYLFNLLPITRDVLTLVVTLVGSIGVFQELRRRSGFHCACLGNVIKLPLSTVSLVEDVGMAAMALVMLILY